MKYKKNVFKSLALITQLGISMMVPIALCVAIGVWIDRKFGTFWVIPLMVLGMAAGGRNVYTLAMNASKDGKNKKNANYEAFESELLEDERKDDARNDSQ